MKSHRLLCVYFLICITKISYCDIEDEITDLRRKLENELIFGNNDYELRPSNESDKFIQESEDVKSETFADIIVDVSTDGYCPDMNLEKVWSRLPSY